MYSVYMASRFPLHIKTGGTEYACCIDKDKLFCWLTTHLVGSKNFWSFTGFSTRLLIGRALSTAPACQGLLSRQGSRDCWGYCCTILVHVVLKNNIFAFILRTQESDGGVLHSPCPTYQSGHGRGTSAARLGKPLRRGLESLTRQI